MFWAHSTYKTCCFVSTLIMVLYMLNNYTYHVTLVASSIIETHGGLRSSSVGWLVLNLASQDHSYMYSQPIHQGGYFLVWQMADWSPVTLCQIWSQLKQFRWESPWTFGFTVECFKYFIHLLSGSSGETVSVGVVKPWWTVCSLSLYPFL